MSRLFDNKTDLLPHAFKQPKLSLFFKLLYLEKRNITSIFYLSLGINILFFTIPVGIQVLVNHFSLFIFSQPTFFVFLLIIILLAVAIFMKAAQMQLTERLQRRFFVDAACGFSNTIQNIKDEFKNKFKEKHMVNLFFEVVTLQKTFSGLVVQGFALALQVVIGLLIIGFYHPFLIIFSVILLGMLYFAFFIAGRGILTSSIAESEKKYKVVAWIEELIQQNKIITHEENSTKVNSLITDYLTSRDERFKITFRQSKIILFIYAFSSIALLSIGGFLIVQQKMTLGQLVAAELIITSILQTLFKFVDLLDYWFDSYVAIEKLNKAISHHISDQEKQIINFSNALTLDNPLWIKFARSTGYVIFGIFVLSLFLPWAQTVSGEGRVIALDAQERRQELSSPIDGRVQKWFFNEGDKVKKGDLIVELTDNDPQILERIEAERNALVKKFESLELARKTSANNVTRQSELFKQGLASKRNLELAKMELAKLESDEASALADLSRIDVKLSRQEQQNIIAPMDGTLVRILSTAMGGTQYVNAGEPLAILVPEVKSRAVETWVRGNDVPWIKENSKVYIQFEGWPAIQFSGVPFLAVGTFEGVVRSVDAVDDGNGNFRLIVTPVNESKWPSQDYLRQGVRAITWVNIGTVPFGYEIWRQFNGFPPSSLNKEAFASESKVKKTKDDSSQENKK